MTYELSKGTLAVLPLNTNQSLVYEDDERYIINSKPFKIMEDSCMYYGSTYEGRKKSAKSMLGAEYKVPVIVDEVNNIIVFPTQSPQANDCCFVSLTHYKGFEKIDSVSTKIIFDNNQEIIVPCSARSIENQVHRSNTLECTNRKRRNM